MLLHPRSPGPAGAPLNALKSTLVTSLTSPASRRAVLVAKPIPTSAVTDEQCLADIAWTSKNRALSSGFGRRHETRGGRRWAATTAKHSDDPCQYRAQCHPVRWSRPRKHPGRYPGRPAGSSPRALVELEGYATGPTLAPSGSARWSCRRELISSLVNTLRRCHSTVRTDRNSWAAISRLAPTSAPVNRPHLAAARQPRTWGVTDGCGPLRARAGAEVANECSWVKIVM